MKTLLLFCAALVCGTALAANPTFQSFDTNDFIATANINFITANTSPLNPLSLVTQAQLAGAVGPTNGVTAGGVTNIVNFIATNNYIVAVGGTGTNDVLGTLTVLNGTYKTLYFADGSYLRTNTFAPFDWEFHQTNGTIGYGTNNVTKITITKAGLISAVALNATTTLSAASGAFGVSSVGLITDTYYSAAPAKTNAVFFDSSGALFTNDWTSIIASLPGSGTANNSNYVVTVTGGANITATPSLIPNGGTNFSVALNDPINLSTATVATLWATNSVTPTNTMGGTAIDFKFSEATTNLAGALTLTSLANLTAGSYNRKLMHVINNTGSPQTVTLATGWGVGIADTFVCTNGTRMNLWAECQPGVFTNVFQKQIVTH